jgi:Family of unknown function (DUF6502)
MVAFERVLDPLIALMFDAGLSVHEFEQLVRKRAVHVAARRVSQGSCRDSNSRVAIITGLSRSEVARLLKLEGESAGNLSAKTPARRVIAAWFDNPRFQSATGDPSILQIFGRRRSFEQLVSMYGSGIPVRAMLDELVQMDAVEPLSDQRVRAKSRNPFSAGLTDSAIANVGERTKDLLKTLSSNLRNGKNSLFELTVEAELADLDMVSSVRMQLAERGKNFIEDANQLVNQSIAKQPQSNGMASAKCRLGVTLYYFEDREHTIASKTKVLPVRRKNLRRQRPDKSTR